VSQLEDAQQQPSEAVIDLTYVPGIAQRRRNLSLLVMASLRRRCPCCYALLGE